MATTFLKYGDKKVRFKTYLTTRAKQIELLGYAKTTKFSKVYGEESTERSALIVRLSKKPVILETRSSEEPVELFLTTIGWDDDGFTSGGDNSPYERWQPYEISYYYY